DLPPIGRALPNCEIHLLDESLQAAPVGAAADLYVSGLPLARGYRNQPELTAERFIRNPFEKTPGEKIYKTGDVARRLSDGTIEFLGRSDLQVKIRGHRIELGEVEAVVGKHPGVAGCAVLAVEGFGGRELVAFVVPRKDVDLSLVSLREWSGRQLPDYMIPARFALLDVLPLTSNGKVDRQALAQTKGREVPIGVEYAAPRHELERKLSEIWKEVLAREAIGIQDNFFEMGGNSLLVTACCVEINKRLGLQVPLGLIFANPTIGGLAEKLNTFSDPAAPIPRADRHLALPASYGQEAMWFVQQILPDPATYNQPFAWRFSGSIDEKRLRVALETVMSRHEVLRTALVFEDGGLQQKISPAGELKLPWRKTVISEGSDPTRLLREESRGPFDLAHAPLWRALWVKLADDENILLLTFHHSIIDEWSMRVLVAELQSLYAGDMPVDLPLQYADYAVWQRRNLSAQGLESATSYWRRQLADLPAPLSLPAAVQLPPQVTGRGVTHGFELPADVITSLRSLAWEEATTVFVVMLAAFQLWLCRRSGQNDLVVATPFAERDRPETQSLIGCFLNTLPIRTKFEEGENFRALLRRVRETVLAAFDHAQMPLAKMVGLALPRRESGDRSLFQAMFVLLEEGVQPVRLDQVVAREIICDTGTSKLDLTLFIHAEGDVWDCRLECSSDLFSQEQGARMAGEMADFFRAVA
ncbi:MAG: condensation domain-containing protein, partial [Verrucomicrobiota bacterium]